MVSPELAFAQYCCELLGSVAPCAAKRMFGGFGLSSEGMTLAIIADLGQGETLWLKAAPEDIATFDAAGCQRFTYPVKGVPKSMNYYSAPPEAMESPALMQPWARLALKAAVQARANAKPKRAAGKRTSVVKSGAASTTAGRKK